MTRVVNATNPFDRGTSADLALAGSRPGYPGLR